MNSSTAWWLDPFFTRLHPHRKWSSDFSAGVRGVREVEEEEEGVTGRNVTGVRLGFTGGWYCRESKIIMQLYKN